MAAPSVHTACCSQGCLCCNPSFTLGLSPGVSGMRHVLRQAYGDKSLTLQGHIQQLPCPPTGQAVPFHATLLDPRQPNRHCFLQGSETQNIQSKVTEVTSSGIRVSNTPMPELKPALRSDSDTVTRATGAGSWVRGSYTDQLGTAWLRFMRQAQDSTAPGGNGLRRNSPTRRSRTLSPS